jgi:hypothetical protein
MSTKNAESEIGAVYFETPQSGTVLQEIGAQSVFRIASFAGTYELSHGSSFVLNHENSKTGTRLWCLTNRHVVHSILNLFHDYRKMIRDGAPDEFVKDLPVGLRVHFGEHSIIIDSLLVPKGEFFKTQHARHLDFAIFSFIIPNLRNLKYFPIAEQKDIAAGIKLFALGYPTVTNLSITDGILSRVYAEGDGDVEREAGARIAYFQWGVQHSILINPGNSGGPTIDEFGRVIGISTFGDPGLKGAVGLSFSLNARSILDYISDPSNLEDISVPLLTNKLAQRAIESARYG